MCVCVCDVETHKATHMPAYIHVAVSMNKPITHSHMHLLSVDGECVACPQAIELDQSFVCHRYAIAHAVLQHLSRQVRCRLLFATHYHPLTADFAGSPHVGLGHMAAIVRDEVDPQSARQRQDGAAGMHVDGFDTGTSEDESHITFLYQLRQGACPRSYGLQVLTHCHVHVVLSTNGCAMFCVSTIYSDKTLLVLPCCCRS